MANVYPLDYQPTYRLDTQPVSEPGADVIVITSDDAGEGNGYDPVSNTTQVEGDDGDIEVSFGPPAPTKRSSNFDDNLADRLEEFELSAVAERLWAGIEADDQSRSQWLQNASDALGLLGLEIKSIKAAGTAAETPSEGLSQVDHPLLLEAVLRFQANARGELLPSDGPVKVRNDGEANAANDALAKALEKDLNHYLTVTAREYYPDTDRMLLLLGFSGIAFKKGYHDPIKRRPVIASIDAKDLIVSNTSTNLEGAGRITHRMMMRPSVLKRMQMLGAYRDVDLPTTPTVTLKNPVDQKIDQIQGVQPVGLVQETVEQDRELYECYCEIELPGFEHEDKGKQTGLPLPYKVVIDKDSHKILEIRRNWEEDDPLCMPVNRIIAYTFIPGIGFYGIGLLNVLGNATKAITAAWRLMLDSGMYANFPGFLFLKQLGKQMTNQFRVAPGQGQGIEAPGVTDIRAAIMPLPYKDPSAVFIQLIDNIANMARNVGGTAEMQIGEGRQDAPVGTTLALIEQATKIMSAVHKRLHQAQGQELVMLSDLIREDPGALWRHNKKSKVLELLKQQAGLGAVDTEQETEDERQKQMLLAALSDLALVPAADPNTSGQTERYLKIMALRQIAQSNPNIDLNAVDQRALRTIGIDDPESLFKPVDPNAQGQGPQPDVLMAQASLIAAQARLIDAQTKKGEAQTKAASAAQDAQDHAKELASKENVAKLAVQRELIIHAGDQRMQAHQLDVAQADKAADRTHELNMQGLSERAKLINAREDRLHKSGLQDATQQHKTGLQNADQQHKTGLQNAEQQHTHVRDAVSQAHEAALKATEGVAPATE